MFPALALALLVVTAGSPPKRPTQGAIARAIAHASPTMVDVIGPKKAGTGTGVIVSSQGHVVTSVDFVKLEDAEVARGGKAPERTAVTFSDAGLGLALLRLDVSAEQHAAAVRLEPPSKQEWLIALVRAKKGGLKAELTQVLSARGTHRILDGVFPPGTPLYDGKGRLVAMTISHGRAVPVSALRKALGVVARQGNP